MNIVAIVQARMGSSRMPGKILKDISGKPMLWHVINRLKSCNLLNSIVVAASINPKDNCVEEFCRKFAVEFHRGSETDVLDRYYQAARVFKADALVRITADCPLIDPRIVDKVVERYLKNTKDFDGASNVIRRTYPRGLDAEIYSFSAMETVHREAKMPYQREHVTIYIHEHRLLFKVTSIENSENLSYLRWTVDEVDDLKFAREIYNALYSERHLFFMEDVLEFLKNRPELNGINRHVKQKTIV